MNLHALTFEQILRVCGSLEDPKEIKVMIEALEVLERNIRYRRKELTGMLKGLEIRDERKRQEQRRAIKGSLRVVRNSSEERDSEEEMS
jgi:hypothetical protein